MTSWSDIEYAPNKQIFLFIISIILFIAYVNKVFANNDYNNLCLAYSIFIFAWLGTIMFRYVYLSYYPRDKVSANMIVLPYGLRCLYGEAGCETANFCFFSIIHIVAYILIGYFVPDQYIIILVISILCEFFEFYVGFQAKFVLDPIINLFGYFIGNQIRKWSD